MKSLLLLISALSLASAQLPPNTTNQTNQTAILGNCTEAQLTEFAFGLPNPLECVLAFTNVFVPTLVNTTMGVNEALENLCTPECGGSYADFLETTCRDPVIAETLRIYCTRTDGTSSLGEFCRFSAGDIADPDLLLDLNACHNTTANTTCNPGCEGALLRLRDEVGCCYQHFLNNSEYLAGLLQNGLISIVEYVELAQLNDPLGNPWTSCGVHPPRRCQGEPFDPPPTPTVPTTRCTADNITEFFTTLPNPETCGPAVLNAVGTNRSLLNDALETLCTRDCGGRYAEFLERDCDDGLLAETLRIYCTRTDGSSSLGDYCRFSSGDLTEPSLLQDLVACDNYTVNNTCSLGCRRALNRLMEQLGCCYQHFYNDTEFASDLFAHGFITFEQYLELQRLNNPTINPWVLCDIRPPERCRSQPFGPRPEPDRCSEQDMVDFVSSLPNAEECGLGLFNIFTPPYNDSTAVPNAIAHVCNNECGGAYSNFLENTCREDLAAAVLRVYCTPTNGTANAGSHCRYTTPEFIDITLLTDLFVCGNNTEQRCDPACRSALIRLKDELGCCYQEAYNSTQLNTVLLNTGTIDLTDFILRLSLGNPDDNPWIQCDVTPPSGCPPPPFEPPEPLCTFNETYEYISTLPNPEVCGPALSTVFIPPNSTTELNTALENVCSRDCGGRYANFLRRECDNEFVHETLRIYCTRSDGTSAAGDYCRYSAGDIFDASLFDELHTACNFTVEQPCNFVCQNILLHLRNELGCCYQNLYNNTLYYTLLLNEGFITHTDFLGSLQLNNPIYNIWDACNVTAPERCEGNPFPDDRECPRGTYRENRMCRRCPDNTDLSQSGGDATICPCLRGYFRAYHEGPSDRCSAPPDACRNIQVLRRGSRNITLSWSRPRNARRDDLYYIIEYRDMYTTGQHPVDDRGNRVEEDIGGLRPNTEYRFTVTVHNGVSDQDERNENLRQCGITARTDEGLPSPPTRLEALCAAVGWRFPLTPNGRITGYDVELREPGSDGYISLYSRGDGTYVAVPVYYQVYGARVRARARTMAGPGAWTEPIDLGCEEIAEPTCPPCECPETSPPTPGGLYFTLGDVAYPNNSVILLTSVGQGDDALFCRTNNENCCGTKPNRFGEFYYPDGRLVPLNRAGEAFYRNRGDSLIRLNRRGGGSTGTYRCELPDADGVTMSIFITLVA